MSLDIRSDRQLLGIRLLTPSPVRGRLRWRALLLLAALPLAARAQRPDIAARAAKRLPAPLGVTVRQSSPNEVTVTWNAVENAKSYVIGRAVGTGGYRRMPDASTRPDTVYLDHALTVGARHGYTITPISLTGLSGLRATSDFIVPRGPDPITTGRITGSISATLQTPGEIRVNWQATALPSVNRFVIRHRLNQSIVAMVRPTNSYVVFGNVRPGIHRFELVDEPTTGGGESIIAMSGTVYVANTAIGSSEVPTPPTAGYISGTTAMVPAAVAVPLRIGATIKAFAVGRWSSLDPAIATVRFDGTITGRAIGTTQIVAHAVEPSGAMRVTVVRVDVKP